MRMSKEEAGEVIQALLTWIFTGEEPETDGRADILLCQMIDMLDNDILEYKENAEKKEQLRKKRSAAGRKGAMAKHAKEAHAGSEHGMPDSAETSSVLPEAASVCCGLTDKNKEYKNTEIRYTETEKDTEAEPGAEKDTYCSEPPPAVSELPVEEIPLNDGSLYPVFRGELDEYTRLYPAVDVAQELRNIRGWCLANPKRRKTRQGVNRFVNSWLSKAQDRGGTPRGAPENPFLAYARGEKESRVIRL